MIVGCDIDGVLADVRPFYCLIPDWSEYYKHTLELPPISEMVALVDSLIEGRHRVVFITGRPEHSRYDTVSWLTWNIPSLDIPDVRMRQDMDFRESVNIKMEVIRELKPSFVIEDEPKAVEAMRAEGFTVLQVHGYRLTKEDIIPYLAHEV